jgi:hypothetical protein
MSEPRGGDSRTPILVAVIGGVFLVLSAAVTGVLALMDRGDPGELDVSRSTETAPPSPATSSPQIGLPVGSSPASTTDNRPAGATPQGAAGKPAVTSSSSSGRPGSKFYASGSGFKGIVVVILRWEFESSGQVRVRTDEYGSFEQVVVVPARPSGRYVLYAEPLYGSPPAKATFEITR